MDETWDSDGVRTPQSYFDELNRRHSFCIDLFSSNENRKVSRSYTAEDSAFDHDWPKLTEGWSFANPMYSRGNLERFVVKAIGEAKKGSGIVGLIPATPGTQWFQDRLLRCCDVLDAARVERGVISGWELSMSGLGYRQRILFLRGRVPFAPPIGWPENKPWNPPATDSIILELRPPL